MIRFEQMILPSLPSSERIQHLAHIHDLNHILKTIVFSIFENNIMIAIHHINHQKTVTLIFPYVQQLLCSKAIQASSIFADYIIYFMHAQLWVKNHVIIMF